MVNETRIVDGLQVSALSIDDYVEGMVRWREEGYVHFGHAEFEMRIGET